MDPSVLAFTLVVLAALVFGVATAPLGLVLGLGPGPTAVGVFLGSAAFVFISVPMVTDRVPDRLARQIRRGVVHGPRVARWWRRPAGDRATGNRAAALVTRCWTGSATAGSRSWPRWRDGGWYPPPGSWWTRRARRCTAGPRSGAQPGRCSARWAPTC